MQTYCGGSLNCSDQDICYIIMKKERRKGTSLLKTCFAQHVDEIKTENQKTQSYRICLGSWFNVVVVFRFCFLYQKSNLENNSSYRLLLFGNACVYFQYHFLLFQFQVSTNINSDFVFIDDRNNLINKYVNMVLNIHRKKKAY